MVGTMKLSRRGLLQGALALGASSVVLQACQTAAQQAVTSGDFTQLQALADRYVGEGKLASVVFSVQRGKTAAPRFLTAGRISRAPDAAIADADSIYRLYSQTKPITGVAVMKLVEDGVLTLDTPVYEFLPQFREMRVLTEARDLNQTAPAHNPILVRHLITHTAGFTYHINEQPDAGPLPRAYRLAGIKTGGSAEQTQDGEQPIAANLTELCDRLAALPLNREPGTAWEYATGLDVAGAVIERASGKQFGAYLKENFFEPLGMSDTDFYVPADKFARFTTNYRHIEETQAYEEVPDRTPETYGDPNRLQCGGAGLVSTARDFSKWAGMLLNDGALGRVRVLRRETALTAHSDLMPQGVTFRNWGREPQGFGAGGSVITTPSQYLRAGTFGWGGAAGTDFWVDPANEIYVGMMIQIFGRVPIGQEARAAAYTDFGV